MDAAAAAESKPIASRAVDSPAARIVARLACSTTPLSSADISQLCCVMWGSSESNTTSIATWMQQAESCGSQAVAAVVCQFAFGAWLRCMLLGLSQHGKDGKAVTTDSLLTWLGTYSATMSRFEHALLPDAYQQDILLGAPALVVGQTATTPVHSLIGHCIAWSCARGLWAVLEGLGWGSHGESAAPAVGLMQQQNTAAAALGVSCSSAACLRRTVQDGTLVDDAYLLLHWLDGSRLVPGGGSTRDAAGTSVGPLAQWRALQCGVQGVGVCNGSTSHPLAQLCNGLEWFDMCEEWALPAAGDTLCGSAVQLLVCCAVPSAREWAMRHCVGPALDGGSASDDDAHMSTVIPVGSLVMALCGSGHLQEARAAVAQAAAAGTPPSEEHLAAALILAAYVGDVDALEWLVGEQGVPVDALVPERMTLTALHAAAWGGHVDVLDALLAEGATTGLVFDEHGECCEPSMHRACAGGHLAAVQRLHAAGASPQAEAPQQHIDISHAIAYAVQSGNVQVMQYVAEHCQPQAYDVMNAAVECCWQAGCPTQLKAMTSLGLVSADAQRACITRLCQYGRVDTMRELLCCGFSFDQTAALSMAAASGHQATEKMNTLLMHGGWLTPQDAVGGGGRSALLSCSYLMQLPGGVLSMVLKTGRSNMVGDGTAARGMAGRQQPITGMSQAAGRRHPSAHFRMLAAGAEPNTVDRDDRGAMTQLLMTAGQTQVLDADIRCLLSFGASTQRGRGRTWPTHLTTQTNCRLKEFYFE